MNRLVRLLTLAILFVQVTAFVASAAENPGGDYGKKSGIIPDFVIGPRVTALGLPVPFRGGLETKWDNLIGLSFDYGFLPSLSFDNVSVGLSGWNVAAHIYPWKGAFFAGLAFGAQNLTGSDTGTVSGVPTTVTVNFNSTFIAPEIGWRWVWNSGFYLGMELGVQIPLSTSSNVSATTSTSVPGLTGLPEYLDLQSKVNSKANTYGNNPFPQFALLQIGYFF